jgi:monofunctional biosynthetic peptidoglycan transglycosylase
VAKTAKKNTRGRKAPAGRSRPLWRRALRLIVRFVGVLVLIPLVLVPVYTVVPPVSLHMILTRLTAGPIERTWVPFDEIAPVLVQSVMMSEDGQFCSHGGVDWQALDTVIDERMDGERSRGASTIAMQTVRNLFLWQNRSFIRKGLEIPLALYADTIWSKRRQMEIYLNIAQWGPNVFGVEAAAQHYFNRPASGLSADQAALLAVALPNPITRDPAHPSARLRALARIIDGRARQSGAYIVCLYP